MFSFLKKRKEFPGDVEVGPEIFDGFIDWHCHILPGVDDGVQTMEEALAILDQYEEWGVRQVWLTPHIMEDIPNTTQALRERFAELQQAYETHRLERMQGGEGAEQAGGSEMQRKETKPVQLQLAAENMMDNLFEERLAAGDVLPITTRGDHLLVETSYYNPPMHLYEILAAVKEAGYQPILAHPERYVYMEMRDYERLKGMGVKFQLNLFSQTGRYGKHVINKMYDLVSKHYYSYVGTDLHRIAMLEDVPRLKLGGL